jgi:hypothetical protein
MVDFVMQQWGGGLTIESLSFDRFVSILKEEIQFDPAEHGIFYSCTRGMTVPIPNERAWKAAIGDMYAGGMDTFDFHVEETGEYLSNLSGVYLSLANIENPKLQMSPVTIAYAIGYGRRSNLRLSGYHGGCQ